MVEFQCCYEAHLGEAILGFCFHIDCYQNPNFCLRCLKNKQQSHNSQCLGFETIKEHLQKYIQTEKQFQEQLQEREKKFQKILGQSLKSTQNNIKKLEDMIQSLEKKEYLKVKKKINFFRKYFLKIDETEKSQFLTSINSIILTLNNATQDYVKIDDLLNVSTEDNSQQYYIRAKGIFEQGKQLFDERKYQEALKALNDSLQMGYNHENVYNLKALTLFNLNQYDEAINFFDQALQTNQYIESAYNNKGALLNKLGKFEEALIYIEQALDLNPNNEHAYNNKGYALCNLNKNSEALIAFDQAINLNNNNENALYYKGKTLLKLKRYEEALLCFEQAIKINQKNDKAYEKKALCLHMLSNYNEALKIYDQAIFINKTANKFNAKADTLLALGRRNEAKQYFIEALRLGNLTSEQEQILKKLESL